MTIPLWRKEALALHKDFMQGICTPTDALLSCLDRIDEVQPRINATLCCARKPRWRRLRPAPNGMR
jgi:Asp-tRNA(Asn)/Glu-tRNA(Gln) amidotransferase A subunit family amidase